MLAVRIVWKSSVKLQKKRSINASPSIRFNSIANQVVSRNLSSQKSSSEKVETDISGNVINTNDNTTQVKTHESHSTLPSESQPPIGADHSVHSSQQKPETYLHNASKTVGATLHYADQKLHTAAHYAGQTYEDLEKNLMKTLKATNQRDFRIKLVGAFLFLLWIVAAFGDRIRKSLTDQTAGLAKETLENESLKIQTQELAMAVVQTILNDKEITAHAAAFLKEASVAPETQQALLELTVHILQHEDSLAQLTTLAKNLIGNLSGDQEMVTKCASLLTAVLEDAKLKSALVGLLTDLCRDPQVVQTVTEMALTIIARNDIYNATTDLLTKSSTELLANEKVQDQSRAFVAEVMGDDALQREGGDALWNSITHALKPGFVRVTGAVVVGVSFAIIRVLFSPY